MLYCISDASFPMSYVSSGNLVSEGGFVHPRRILDTFVFILVQQGTLHITQGQKNYSVHSNELRRNFQRQSNRAEYPPNIRALSAARIRHLFLKPAADFTVCAIAGHFQAAGLPHDMEFSLCPEPAAHGAFHRSPDHPAD